MLSILFKCFKASIMCYQMRFYSNVCKLKPFKDTKWLMPEGNPIGVNVYNCVAAQKVPIILNDPKIATWYSCGPTVYDSAHIGHASSYVKIDIIQRILKSYFNVNLITVMGVTNIDDKIILRAKESGESFEKLANRYENEFFKDMTLLGNEKPVIITKVTDYMKTIESFIKQLLESNKAYVVGDGSVYFDISQFKGYGKLEKAQESHEKNIPGKRNEQDFAIWKAAKKGEPFWEVPWGKGRPGWHIECSAMISKLFGSQVDFHAGGVDLKFPHHENEEAQSCSYHNCNQWVNYWIHTGHLHVKNDVKMSKSLNNTISINELLNIYNPNVFRMACLLSHYSNSMEYTDEMMKNAETVLNKFKYFINYCYSYVNQHTLSDSYDSDKLIEKLTKIQESVDHSLRDDFDTPACINNLITFMTDVYRILNLFSTKNFPIPITLILLYVRDIMMKFGVNLDDCLRNTNNCSEILDILVDFRHDLRLKGIDNKNDELLKACDEVREKLKSLGVKINDGTNNIKSTWIKT